MSYGWNPSPDDDPRRLPITPSAPDDGARWKGMDLGLPAEGPGSLAGVGRRLGGLVLDVALFIPVLIVGAILRHPHLVTEVSATGVRTQRVVESRLPLATAVALMVPTAAYVIGMVAWRGQTLGEQAMGLRVIRLIDRQHPGLTPALARWSVLAVVGVIGLFAPRYGSWLTLWTLLVYVWALWDRNRQGLHDKFARVIVVRTG